MLTSNGSPKSVDKVHEEKPSVTSHSGSMPGRRYELDWIRVLIIANLIPFHVAWLMAYIPGFSEARGSDALIAYVVLFARWHMPILFLIAGVSSTVALSWRSPGKMFVERCKRLLVPLLIYMIFLDPLQGYFWPGDYERSFSDYMVNYWPTCLSTLLYGGPGWPAGGPGWGHLWFVAYLFIISNADLMLRHFFKGKKVDVQNAASDVPTKIGTGIFYCVIPFLLVHVLIAPVFPLFKHNLYTDWGYFVYNLIAYAIGAACVNTNWFWAQIDRYCRVSVVLALVCSVAGVSLRLAHPVSAVPDWTISYAGNCLLFSGATWFCTTACLGLARKYLNRPGRLLAYCSQAAYPFYIIHLPVMVILGHFLRPFGMGTAVEVVVLLLSSFVLSLGIYEYVIKRVLPLRWAFGMK